MTYTFLQLNLFLFLIPFALALDKKVFKIENIRSLIVPSLIVTVIFSEIAVFFTGLKVWEFNAAYLVGIYYRELPLEEYLFIFTFSFAGLGIYNYLNAKFPKNDLQKYSLALSHALMGVCIAMLFFAYTKWYPAITFAFLMMLLIGVEYINTLRFMYKFYRAFVASLILFYICYGVICNLPITTYQATENLGFDLFKIPFENYFFTMGMLLLGVYLLEFFKSRKSV
ncbi:lycopene cyclase domain-containing protein [Pedobacter frigiditerrae]|uniref:Lycopene cyclase domain-containing protein n=1 Tax=Pedobacter frigiditerrae TaxID=2530452 RepID=A0A4R0MMH8_9SPHI|nr:lycopene cyclase domain-containing protein [Pedobacter frigiditerrae]TCC87910.1 lycopene cyclase domain-containing protein [Pedobacter frigiditerrae]